MVNTDESRNVDDLDKSMTISLTSKISSADIFNLSILL